MSSIKVLGSKFPKFFNVRRRVSTKNTSKEASQKTDEENKEFVTAPLSLETDRNYKEDKTLLIVDVDPEKYFIEGFAQLKFDKEINQNELKYASISNSIIDIDNENNYYIKNFFNHEHFNFVGKYNESKNTYIFLFSLKFVPDNGYCSVLRTKDGNKFSRFDELSKAKINQIIGYEISELRPVDSPFASKMIYEYDRQLIKTTFTFGIIYQKFAQVTESEMLSNSAHSHEFEDFLKFIGIRVKLKNFTGFRGGLDTNSDNGEESVYEKYQDSEIMFHVSTMLPHSNFDTQQVDKKRHIGNDKVAIIFQDEDTPFSPDMIRSKLLHVFLIIQPIKVGNITRRYKLSMVARKDVPCFGPYIKKPYIFVINESLKNFILSKLINAEYASLRAKSFSEISSLALNEKLENLSEDLIKKHEEFNDCLKLKNRSLSTNNKDDDSPKMTMMNKFKSRMSIYSKSNTIQDYASILNLNEIKPKSKSTNGYDEIENSIEIPVFFDDRRTGSLKDDTYQYSEPISEYMDKIPNRRFVSLKSENNKGDIKAIYETSKESKKENVSRINNKYDKKKDTQFLENITPETQEMLNYLGKSKQNIHNRRQFKNKNRNVNQ